jgi:hypothetical protein
MITIPSQIAPKKNNTCTSGNVLTQIRSTPIFVLYGNCITYFCKKKRTINSMPGILTQMDFQKHSSVVLPFNYYVSLNLRYLNEVLLR